MCKYKASIQTNVLKSFWHEELETWVYREYFWILATNGRNHFLHYYNFWDDWDKANEVLQRILAAPDFSPENKPTIWYPIQDTKPFYAPKKWYKLKNWWIDNGPQRLIREPYTPSGKSSGGYG